MSVSVTFECDGCDATAGPFYLPHRKFHSFNGKGHGFGSYENPTIEQVVPEGWVHNDPFTGCTYCPKCWAEITEAA